MKIVRKIFYLMFLYSALGFTACSDEEKKIDWNGVEITNTELKNVLQQKGFTFNAAGNLVQDNKVKNTTKLDLSNCNLSDVSGLNAFSNLKEVNLSHNKFQKSFDFSKLPLSVTGVDLTGNEIYEYPGLVNIVTEENGDEKVTILYNLRKLYLPESAKYNCVELPTFYSKNSGVDMQMEDKSGNLLAYTTLREVPDEKLRTYLKETFPSMFEGNVINIAKRMIKEASNNIVINQWLNNEDIEGVEYIIMNPSYKGGAIALRVKEAATLPYLKIPSYIYKVILSKVTTNYVNFTEATNISKADLTRTVWRAKFFFSFSPIFPPLTLLSPFVTLSHGVDSLGVDVITKFRDRRRRQHLHVMFSSLSIICYPAAASVHRGSYLYYLQ